MANDNKKGTWIRMILSGMSILTGGVLGFSLILQGGQGNLSPQFLLLYGLMAGFSLIFGFIAFISDWAIKRLKPDSFLAKSFFIFEKSMLRPGSQFLVIPLLIAGVLSVILAGIVTTADASVFPTVNPYSATLGSMDGLSLDGRSTALNLWNGAVIPGWFEESAIFFAIQLSVFLVLWTLWLLLGRRDEIVKHPFAYWFVALPVIGLWSAIFSLAHGRYGGNTEAFAFAFIFEFVVQLINQATGSFVSWIPHMVHNSMVILNRSFSFVTFAVIPIIPMGLVTGLKDRIRGWL